MPITGAPPGRVEPAQTCKYFQYVTPDSPIYSLPMLTQLPSWPYLPTLARIGLAIAIGLFIGIERERRQKEAGLRTFAFTAMLGAVGGMLGESFAVLALALVGV